MGVTSIQWCDFTFNPWIGCQRVSPGCQRCYAEAYDKRVGGVPVSQRPSVDSPAILRWGPNAPRTRTSASYWKQPLKWDREAKAAGVRKRVFCSSLADVFEDRAEIYAWREDLFHLIAATPNLDWLLLTKRPENIGRLWPVKPGPGTSWPNVWLGTTVEDQKRADERIDVLTSVPAVVHFLSVEPLIEAVNLKLERNGHVDWVIIGGESGGGARHFEAEWARSLVKQCRSAGIAPFVKQMGSYTVDRNDAGFNGDDDGGWHSAVEYGGEIRVEDLDHGYQGAPVRVYLRDRHGGDMAEWPEDLRVREFPEVRP